MWTLSPNVSYSHSSVWGIHSSGYIYDIRDINSILIYPVIYLSSNIQLSGSGTQGSGAYTIVEN